MSESQWEMARPNEAKLQKILENGCDQEQLAQSLLSWLSDDEVGEFARSYGYFTEYEEDEDCSLVKSRLDKSELGTPRESVEWAKTSLPKW